MFYDVTLIWSLPPPPPFFGLLMDVIFFPSCGVDIAPVLYILKVPGLIHIKDHSD
jgi:hypothetical protein